MAVWKTQNLFLHGCLHLQERLKLWKEGGQSSDSHTRCRTWVETVLVFPLQLGWFLFTFLRRSSFFSAARVLLERMFKARSEAWKVLVHKGVLLSYRTFLSQSPFSISPCSGDWLQPGWAELTPNSKHYARMLYCLIALSFMSVDWLPKSKGSLHSPAAMVSNRRIKAVNWGEIPSHRQTKQISAK